MLIKKNHFLTLLVFSLIFFVLFLLFKNNIFGELKLIELRDGSLKISDFAYYILLAKAFWFDGANNLYSLSGHTEILRTNLGYESLSVMPLAMSPSFLILLYPFAYLFRSFDMETAQSAWMAFSWTFLFFSFWVLFKKLEMRSARLWFLAFFSTLLLSSVFVVTSALGQFSIFALACLLLFVYACTCKQPVMLLALLTFFLSAKTTYTAYFLLGVLLFFGFSLFVCCGILFSLSFLSLSPFLSPQWLTDYMTSYKVFTLPVIPPEYRDAFSFETMNIFRSAFPELNVVNASSLFMLGVFVFVFGGALLFSSRMKEEIKHALLIAFVAAHQLFAPYLGGYEDMLVFFLIAMLFAYKVRLQNKNFAILFIFALLTYNVSELREIFPSSVLWACKTILFFFLAIIWLKKASRSLQQSPS